MPINDPYVGQKVLVVPFKGHQILGEISEIKKDGTLLIKTSWGTEKITPEEIREIK